MARNLRKTVLIVEADPVLRGAMAQSASRMGLEVMTAPHYNGAIELLSQRKPNLVSIDLRLPSESGYELCEYIRNTLGLISVPILVTCRDATLHEMACAEEAGANAFLAKPFSMDHFADYLSAMVDGPRSERFDALRARLGL